jgi:GT2 family glycosyltransferase
MKIVVIVVTYNGEQWIDKCFASLVSSTIPLQVYAIDNASTDRTVLMIKERFPQVQVVENNANLGFGQANNVGFRIALKENVDYVFLLNQDAWIENNTVEKLVTVANTHPQFGITSPFHFNWDATKVDHYFLTMVNPNDCPGFLSDHYLNNIQDIYPVNFIHAACWLISKNCLAEVGGFDPLFYHYGEDNDYVSRIKRLGYKIGISPGTNVYHYGFFDTSKGSASGVRFKKIESLLELKNLQGKLIANYFFYFKRRFDRATTLLFSKNFRNSWSEILLFMSMLKYYSRIKMARKTSKQPQAFL